MKIALVTSERLYEFPPIMTLLHILDRLEFEVVFITPFQDADFDGLGLLHARNLFVSPTLSEWLTSYHSNRIAASVAYRSEHFLRSINIRKIPEKFKEELDSADVVWVLHENTFLLGGKSFADKLGQYLYTMYELCIKNSSVPDIYDYAARKALLTVVPEYNRAHIVKAFYSLPHVPAIISNQPTGHPRQKNLPISDPVIAERISELKAAGKKIVMYMGILIPERPLEPIIEAVEQMDDYVLVVLGNRMRYLDQLEKTMGGRFEYLGSVKPPHHLEVASHADVAYISYVANDGAINAVFCAPNKVYEFAGFGIPMLCNDIPGLKYSVEYNGMGVCIPELTTPHIAAALKQIDANAETMREAANRYFDAESVEQAVIRTLERYTSIKKASDR